MPKSKKKGPAPNITPKQLRMAYEQGRHDAARDAIAIFLTVLADKFNGAEYIPDVWREVLNLSESIVQGYVDVGDLKRVLRKEYGIKV